MSLSRFSLVVGCGGLVFGGALPACEGGDGRSADTTVVGGGGAATVGGSTSVGGFWAAGGATATGSGGSLAVGGAPGAGGSGEGGHSVTVSAGGGGTGGGGRGGGSGASGTGYGGSGDGGTPAGTGGQGMGGSVGEGGSTGVGGNPDSTCVSGVQTGSECHPSSDTAVCVRSNRTCVCDGATSQWTCTSTEGVGGSTGVGGSSGIGGDTGVGGTSGDTPITIYLAGDSIVCAYTDTAASTTEQAGWGQMLHEYFNDQVTIDNRASGGRTARWFALEGGVDSVLSTIKPGDYFLIQFGTNDSNNTAGVNFTVDGVTYPRYAAADTDFKTYLKDYYLDPTRAVGAIPVLVTPPPRNSGYCGGNGTGAWAAAMRELGAAEDVLVFDLNQFTMDYLQNLGCPAPTPETFYFTKADGSIDGTHFQENGARIMAGFIADSAGEQGTTLGAYLK